MYLWQDQTILMASMVPIPAALGSPAGPNQWFCGAPVVLKTNRCKRALQQKNTAKKHSLKLNEELSPFIIHHGTG